MVQTAQILNSTFNLPNLADRFLEGNGTGYLGAGLPNITGMLNNVLGRNINNTGWNGAFSQVGVGSTYPTVTSTSNEYGTKVVSFSAANSSSIYGNSTTVQPATCKCYFVIKY